MTLAVAGLAIAAIFLSSSAGLLSRFYDREREFRLAAESALEQVRSRLLMDSSFAIPDTGVVQLLAGHQILDAAGAAIPGVRVNVYAATTGDTTGRWLPHVTLIATSFDPNGTRHVRRMDLRRESFSRYSLFADSFPSSVTFGPGVVAGRVHTNQTWRSGSSVSAALYRDTVTAGVAVVEGSSVFDAGTVVGVPAVTYPVASDYAWYDSLATAGNLAFSVVNGSGPGWRSGTRLEFVPVDADGDGVLDPDEGFARVFDLENGMDTTRLTVGLNATDVWGLFALAKRWNDPVVQNQCGAFYLRDGRWQFFPVATHRAAWARDVIQATGAASFPPVTNPKMNAMNDYDYDAAELILEQSTARCFPAGSPYLMATERFTNASGTVTGTAADVYPFGTAPSFTWPGLPYGGSDTTFTVRSRSCTISVASTTGQCESGDLTTLGVWRAFGGGTPLSGVSSTIRQANELPYLWPFAPARNAGSSRVMVATGGPLFVSGEVRGDVLLSVAGAVRIIEKLVYAGDPSDPAAEPCEDQLGLVAAGDILVSDNALTRGRRIVRGGVFVFGSLTKQLGPERDVAVHGALMSLGGTVGVENPNTAGIFPVACPQDGSNNTSGGCLRIVGGMVMRHISALQGSGSSGLRYAGVPDRCQGTTRRPPYFPLTNRYALVRTLEVEPSQANTPALIRALLLRLKGPPL